MRGQQKKRGDPKIASQVQRSVLHSCRLAPSAVSTETAATTTTATGTIPATAAITVAAAFEPDGARAFLAVADRGPGIAVAEQARIFRKFARGGGARAGGLGLGLSIVQGFVAAQGGTVAYRDNPGGGAVFTIYLPHRTPQGEPAP